MGRGPALSGSQNHATAHPSELDKNQRRRQDCRCDSYYPHQHGLLVSKYKLFHAQQLLCNNRHISVETTFYLQSCDCGSWRLGALYRCRPPAAADDTETVPIFLASAWSTIATTSKLEELSGWSTSGWRNTIGNDHYLYCFHGDSETTNEITKYKKLLYSVPLSFWNDCAVATPFCSHLGIYICSARSTSLLVVLAHRTFNCNSVLVGVVRRADIVCTRSIFASLHSKMLSFALSKRSQRTGIIIIIFIMSSSSASPRGSWFSHRGRQEAKSIFLESSSIDVYSDTREKMYTTFASWTIRESNPNKKYHHHHHCHVVPSTRLVLQHNPHH